MRKVHEVEVGKAGSGGGKGRKWRLKSAENGGAKREKADSCGYFRVAVLTCARLGLVAGGV